MSSFSKEDSDHLFSFPLRIKWRREKLLFEKGRVGLNVRKKKLLTLRAVETQRFQYLGNGCHLFLWTTVRIRQKIICVCSSVCRSAGKLSTGLNTLWRNLSFYKDMYNLQMEKIFKNVQSRLFFKKNIAFKFKKEILWSFKHTKIWYSELNVLDLKTIKASWPQSSRPSWENNEILFRNQLLNVLFLNHLKDSFFHKDLDYIFLC